jgi:hypothetical protein
MGIIIFLLLPLSMLHISRAAPSYSFEEAQKVDKGAPVFFLFTLNRSETVHIQIENSPSNYSVLLFNSRPNEIHVTSDGSLDTSILSSPSLVGHNTSINPHLNFSAPSLQEPKMYYMEIILLNGSSDTFILYSTRSLSRYYIPQIPGFHLGILGGLFVGTVVLLALIRRKKVILG